jgi:hypothetical protein
VNFISYSGVRKHESSFDCLSIKNVKTSQVLVAHACHPSYLGDRDQEDHSSKPAWENSSRKTLHKNRARGGLKMKALSSSPSMKKKIEKRHDFSLPAPFSD